MNEVEILEEMLSIYKRYFEVVQEMGAITMSEDDSKRLAELETKLEAIRD